MITQKGLLLGILVLSASISIWGCATTSTVSQEAAPGKTLMTDAPLPEAVSIIPPGPEISPEMTASSGNWFGTWDGEMDHILVLEEIISPQKVIAVYLWGRGFGFNPGWEKWVGKFADNRLVFSGSALVVT
jgi:hypothetical protein